jgi:hypothetical protein
LYIKLILSKFVIHAILKEKAMSVLATKHSKEALAFWTLFKAMKPEIKEGVRDMIMGDNNYEITTDEMTAISLDSFQQIWDAPENEQWNDFIKGRVSKYNVKSNKHLS